MSGKILFVDDDPRILTAFARTLGRSFSLSTALGGAAGLEALTQTGPYAVVISDRQMPGMDGIQFLVQVKAKSPDSVRLMLTGNADLEGAIRVVNESGIFRFLTKPCSAETLTKALTDALAQHALVTAERDLLNNTLRGSVKVLIDLLAMVDPAGFGRAQRMRGRIEPMARRLEITNLWDLQLAALLAPIGMVTLPPALLLKARSGYVLSDKERRLYDRIPEIGRNLVANIPRLGPVAEIVYYQDKCFDGSSFPEDQISGQKIPIGARILKVLRDLETLEARGQVPAEAIQVMRTRDGWYDPSVLDAASDCFGPVLEQRQDQARRDIIPVDLSQLRPGNVLHANLETVDGQTVVAAAGQVVTGAILERIHGFAQLGTLRLPILIEPYAGDEGVVDVFV
jgi:response regulator RpfG family c-di-GMP phosphodiesterase